MHMISKINHIYHSKEDLLNVLNYANERNIRVNLLNEIPNSERGRYTPIDTVIDILEGLGIVSCEIEYDPFSLPVKLFKMKNGASVEVKHLTINEEHFFESCVNCKKYADCKEGIFALRLTPEGCIRPCLVRTDNQFDFFEGDHDEFIKYLQRL